MSSEPQERFGGQSASLSDENYTHLSVAPAFLRALTNMSARFILSIAK
jgi:hypothetical protein